MKCLSGTSCSRRLINVRCFSAHNLLNVMKCVTCGISSVSCAAHDLNLSAKQTEELCSLIEIVKHAVTRCHGNTWQMIA